MTPIFVWIHSGEIVGTGDTRREAFENAQDAVEKTVSLFAAEGITIDVPDIHTGGYGVRIRLSHYPEDADPRSVIALALKPIDESDEMELGPEIAEEILGAGEESEGNGEGNGEDWEPSEGLTDETGPPNAIEHDKPHNAEQQDQPEKEETGEEGGNENAETSHG